MTDHEDKSYPEEPNFLNNDCTINQEWVSWFLSINPNAPEKVVSGIILAKMILYQNRIKHVIGHCWDGHHADMELVLNNNEMLRDAFLKADFSKPSLLQRFLYWIKQ